MTTRLFVALPIPDAIAFDLEGMAYGLPGARPVPPENLHITLRFIGEVDGGLARDIDASLSEIAMPSFPVSLSGVGCFGDGRKTRSIWVGVEPSPELLRLREKVENAIRRAGAQPERRKFRPHVTLARFKGQPGEKLARFISAHALHRSPVFTADHFTLFSSHLAREGAIYTPEAEYPLEHAPLAYGRLGAAG